MPRTPVRRSQPSTPPRTDARGWANAGGAATLALAFALSGCYVAHRSSEIREAGPVDSGAREAGGRDASPHDGDGTPDDGAVTDEDGGGNDGDAGQPSDAGFVDSGTRDGGFVDAGTRDGGFVDAGTRDGGFVDAGTRDGGSFDAGAVDAGRFDGGPRHDSGLPVDAGGFDADLRRDGGLLTDAGRHSWALRFLPDDFVLVPDRPALSTVTETTYEMWVRVRGPGTVSRKGLDWGVQHHVIRFERGPEGTMEIAAGWRLVGGEWREVRAPFDSALGRWTHIALVLERRGERLAVRLDIDFEVAATGEFPDDIGRSYNLEPLQLGRFDGDLDEIRLWASVRDAATLRAYAFMRLPIGTPGLIAYWPFEEAPSQIVLDRSLRGNDGILGARTGPDEADPEWIVDGAIP